MKVKYRFISILATMVLSGTLVANSASFKTSVREYTDEHPLVFEDSWDIHPYSFLDERGNPLGYEVEVTKMILDHLKIPYVIDLAPVTTLKDDLNHGKADLIVVKSAGMFSRYGHYSRNALSLITLSLASPKNRPIEISSLNDLSKHPITVLDSGLVHRLMIDYQWQDMARPVKDINDAILRMSDLGEGQIIWFKPSLEYLQRTFSLDNMQITPIDMPIGEARYIARDQELLDAIDSVYTVLNSEDRFEPLQDKWFYPKQNDWELPVWAWWMLGCAIAIMLVLLWNFVTFRRKESRQTAFFKQQNKRLSLILESSEVRLWTYNIQEQMFFWHDNNGEIVSSQPAETFSKRYYPGDFNRLSRAIEQLVTQSETAGETSLDIRALDSEVGDKNIHQFRMALSVLERDKSGRPTIILGTKKDVTEEQSLKQEAEEKLIRFDAVFNSPIQGVLVFNDKGLLGKINDKACEMLCCNREELLAENPMFYHFFELDGLNIDELDGLHFCHVVNIDRMADHEKMLHSIKLTGQHICEVELLTVKEDVDNEENDKANMEEQPQQRAIAIIAIINNINQYVEGTRLLAQSQQKWEDLMAKKKHYLEMGDDLLKTTGLRILTYSPDSHTLCIMDGFRSLQHELTQTRCMTLIHQRSQKRVMALISKMDNHSKEDFNEEVTSNIRFREHLLTFRIHLMPDYDAKGQVRLYFGILQDITERKTLETQLDAANAKAQEIEHAKNSILKNMCYEIRTPLTGVVGFAEMLNTDMDRTDEEIFSKEILNNSDLLLRLIDDILFYSRIDSQMVEIKRAPCEFVELFQSSCEAGWKKVKRPDVELIVESSYKELLVNTDATNVGHLISSLVTNAATTTTKGYVRARFDFFANRIIITVEDSGSGLTEKEKKSILEHRKGFLEVRSGIALPTCKLLTEMMGGIFDIYSVSGNGTTVWVSIPCNALNIIRKKHS